MEQRTVDWYEWRKAGLGASDAPVVMGVSPWSTPYQLWEQKTGKTEKNAGNWATNRGNEMEPRARATIELNLGLDFPAVLAEHPTFPWMRASLDGYNEEFKIVLEIKCPGKEDHDKAGHGEIPSKYYPQLQHQLFVTGAKKLFYYSYAEDENKNGDGHLVEVLPNIEYMKELLDKMMKFWKCVQTNTEPELGEKDYKNIRSAVIHEDLYSWKRIKDNISILEKQLEEVTKRILEKEDVKGKRVRCGNFKISLTTRKGNVQYTKIPQLENVDLDKYRGKPSVYQTISYKEKD